MTKLSKETQEAVESIAWLDGCTYRGVARVRPHSVQDGWVVTFENGSGWWILRESIHEKDNATLQRAADETAGGLDVPPWTGPGFNETPRLPEGRTLKHAQSGDTLVVTRLAAERTNDTEAKIREGMRDLERRWADAMLDEAYAQHGEAGWRVFEGDGEHTTYDYKGCEVSAVMLQKRIKARKQRTTAEPTGKPHGRILSKEEQLEGIGQLFKWRLDDMGWVNVRVRHEQERDACRRLTMHVISWREQRDDGQAKRECVAIFEEHAEDDFQPVNHANLDTWAWRVEQAEPAEMVHGRYLNLNSIPPKHNGMHMLSNAMACVFTACTLEWQRNPSMANLRMEYWARSTGEIAKMLEQGRKTRSLGGKTSEQWSAEVKAKVAALKPPGPVIACQGDWEED